MINVNQITSQLAKMPDQALQKYAALNKNDPYILALAVAESNRRKEMRQAAQGAQGMMPQPKVADQAVQGMAPAAPMGPAQPMPEDMGIGRLPAGDMNFADGGIVAFADGGEVEHYFEGGFFGDWAAGQRKRQQAKLEEERARNMALVNADSGYAGRGLGILADPRVGAPGVVLPDMEGVGTPYDESTATRRAAFAQTPPPARNVSLMPPAPTIPRAAAAPAPGAAPAAGLPGLNVGTMTEDALAAAAKAPNPFAKDVEALGKEKVAAKEADVKGLEAIQKQFSDIYKGRKERLDTREAEIGKMKDQSLGLALLQAGAAMMTTPGNLGMALGKGVQVGSERYVAGLDKVRAAQEKLSDARDRLEEIEAQRGEMSARELLKARSEVKSTAISAREDLIKSNMQMYGVNRETALKMVDNQIKVGISQFEQASATERALIQERGANARANAQIAATLNTPERQLWNDALKRNNGDTSAAFRELQTLKAEKFNPYQSYADYLKAFAGKENVFSPPMGFADYASQFSVPTATPPKGATVRTLPGTQ